MLTLNILQIDLLAYKKNRVTWLMINSAYNDLYKI